MSQQLSKEWFNFALRAQSECAKGKRGLTAITITVIVSSDNKPIGYTTTSKRLEPARNNELEKVCKAGAGDDVAGLLVGL